MRAITIVLTALLALTLTACNDGDAQADCVGEVSAYMLEQMPEEIDPDIARDGVYDDETQADLRLLCEEWGNDADKAIAG